MDLTAQTSLSFDIGENSEFKCIAIPEAIAKNVCNSKGFPEAVKHFPDFVGDLRLLAQDRVQARPFASTLGSSLTACASLETDAN